MGSPAFMTLRPARRPRRVSCFIFCVSMDHAVEERCVVDDTSVGGDDMGHNL